MYPNGDDGIEFVQITGLNSDGPSICRTQSIESSDIDAGDLFASTLSDSDSDTDDEIDFLGGESGCLRGEKGSITYEWDLSNPPSRIGSRSRCSIIEEENEIRRIKAEPLSFGASTDEPDADEVLSEFEGTLDSNRRSIVEIDDRRTPLPQLSVSPLTMKTSQNVEHSEFVRDNKLITGGTWRKLKLPNWISGNKQENGLPLSPPDSPRSSQNASPAGTPESKKKSLKKTFSLKRNKHLKNVSE